MRLPKPLILEGDGLHLTVLDHPTVQPHAAARSVRAACMVEEDEGAVLANALARERPAGGRPRSYPGGRAGRGCTAAGCALRPSTVGCPFWRHGLAQPRARHPRRRVPGGMTLMPSENEARAAATYGECAGFRTDASPVRAAYRGEHRADEFARLFDLHATGAARFLDVGWGRRRALHRMAGVGRRSGSRPPGRSARAHGGLRQRPLLEANAVAADDLSVLRNGHFDVAHGERGPGFSEALLRTLTGAAVVLQELVGSFDGYPLMEVFGRRSCASNNTSNRSVPPARVSAADLDQTCFGAEFCG